MIKKFPEYSLLMTVMIITLVILTSCVTEDHNSTGWLPNYPSMVNTHDATSVTLTTAVSGGSISWGGRSPITNRGIFWSTSSIFTNADNKTDEGPGSAPFTSKLTGLTANTKYYIKGYATNKYGTGYGSVKQFTTAPESPLVNTFNVLYFTNRSAKAEGIVTSPGLTPVTERGFFWGTGPNPEISGTKLIVGSDTGRFAVNLMSLTPGTIYYIKAFAVNSISIAFGEQMSFTTKTDYSLPDFSLIPAFNVTVSSAECTANTSWDGGSIITEKGICWSTSENPTTTDSLAIPTYWNEKYSSTVTGLTSNTKYYVRGYAINSLGTAYSNQVSFKTRTGMITDIEGNVYYTQIIGSQLWITENLKTTKYNDGVQIVLETVNSTWGTLSKPAYCWYNNSSYYKNTYGAIYNWYAVNSGKLCPSGWHVPTDADWAALVTFSGGSNVAGGYLKEAGTAHWNNPNAGATNESGFTAVPAGERSSGSGVFISDESWYHAAIWWSNTQYDSEKGWYMGVSSEDSKAFRIMYPKSYGLSVRCLKN